MAYKTLPTYYDDLNVWSRMWQETVQLGAISYYMFVELARSARGPVMSATPGKVQIDGVIEVSGQKYFALEMLQ